MTENQNLTTPEEKQQYILNNIDKYIIDRAGNFVNIDPDTEYGIDCFCIGKEAVSNWELISYWMAENIVKNKEDWEMVLLFHEDGHSFPDSFKNKKTGAVMQHLVGKLRPEDYGYLFGEFGYREGPYKDYDKEKEQLKIWREAILKKNNPPTPNPENQPTNSNNQNEENEDNPSPTKEKKDNPTNNPLPSPSEIQNNYKSETDKSETDKSETDKSETDKSETDNNPNLITPEQKEQTNELLKIIISAEILVKKKQLNLEILTKLTTEKKNNSSLYQFLNKEKRIDRAINNLENIKKQSQKDSNKPLTKNKDDNQIPMKLIVVGGIFLLLGLVMIVIARKRKKTKIKH